MTKKEKATITKILETVNALPPNMQEQLLWLGKGMVLAQEVATNGKK